ncbi:MAG: hypothetical protein KDF55_17575 [Thauera sp.]|nr:hypothetical protein [Thauera sp.]
MTDQIERRVAALEAVKPQAAGEDEATRLQRMTEQAARCGYTPEQVQERFGGWPGFYYAMLHGAFDDPANPPKPPEPLPPGVTPMQAYMRMIGKA